jgi:AraC-like DNA-binding protein
VVRDQEALVVTLPLAWLVSVLTAIAAYALARSARTPYPARFFLCAFLLALGTVGLLLGLRLSFGTEWAGRVQPLVAVLIAPAAFLGFRALTEDTTPTLRETLLWNGISVGLVQLAMLARVPISPDVFVLGINGVYLFRTAALLRRHPDEFAQVPPQASRMVRSAIYATIVLLGMMVATDLLIVSAGVFAGDAAILPFLTGVTGVLTAFIFVVALVGVPMVLRGDRSDPARTEDPSDRDRTLMADLDALMAEKHLYADSNLTLARVARRLSVPVRDVSNATNRVTGENFSRYVNGHRIRHAQRALRETELPITEVMFDAGFVSKSSFNTEFRRVVGQTPSQYRAAGADA